MPAAAASEDEDVQMLTAAGVGSGLDIESIITQLMALERRPLERLQQNKSDVQLHISANGQLKSAIARFQAAAKALGERDTLGGVKASSSDDDVLSLSATADATLQDHTVQVLELAAHHRLASGAYADDSAIVGSGTLDIAIGGNTLSLTLDDSNHTLAQLRDAINAAPDNPGVTASIINVDGGSRLILTARDSGTANAITVTPDAGLAGFAVAEVDAARDARLTVDGFEVTRGSNTVSDVIAGVTMTLRATGSATLQFSADSELLNEAVTEFVASYNGLRGNIKALGKNALKGDSMLLGLERSINQRLSTAVTLDDAGTGYLYETGVSFNDQGDLQLDAARLASTVAADPTRVSDLFGSAGGFAVQLDGFLQGYLAADGILDVRNDTLASRDRNLDRQVANVQFRLDKTEQRLRAQFTTLDTLLARLTVTSDYLAQQLLSLSGNANN
jgi:flagellar hook-associated protein 2